MGRDLCWLAYLVTREITFSFRLEELRGRRVAWLTIADEVPIGPLALSAPVSSELDILLGRMVHLLLGLVTLETRFVFRFEGGPGIDDLSAWVTLGPRKTTGPVAVAQANADELGRLLARAMSLLLDAEELTPLPDTSA